MPAVMLPTPDHTGLGRKQALDKLGPYHLYSCTIHHEPVTFDGSERAKQTTKRPRAPLSRKGARGRFAPGLPGYPGG
ncbi:hypothetical protein ABH927_001360 [Planotetraspora sp. GP83]